MIPADPFAFNLTLFALALYIGHQAVSRTRSDRGASLLTVLHALSAIIIVAALLAAALTATPLGRAMGMLALILATIHLIAGLLVSSRLLALFKKKESNET